jgi:hypothetical protein
MLLNRDNSRNLGRISASKQLALNVLVFDTIHVPPMMKLKSVRLFLGAICLSCAGAMLESAPARAISITANNDATALVNNLLAGSSGITATNATYTGSALSAGLFTGGNADGLGIDAGVILSTGRVIDAAGPNDSPSVGVATIGQPGTALIPGTTFDAAILSFDFTTTTGEIAFNYVFGSEEYLEFVNGTNSGGLSVNDQFRFFIDGENIALIPGTTTPISIDTVNSGLNSAFFRDNETGALNLQYDGFTTVLTAQKTGLSAGTHTLQLVIADLGDNIYDSGVFLQAGSITATATTAVPEPFTVIGSIIGGTAAFRMRKKLKSNKA